MLRLALIGCGRHSRREHATPLARYAGEHPGEIELAAACDLDIERARRFCTEFGFGKPYSDISEMLAGEALDGCVCVMPIPRIVEIGSQLLRRGMPCTIEKPPGASLAEVRKLAATARKTRTPHMVSVNRRFMPYLNRGLDWAAERGPVRYVRCTVVRNRRTEPIFISGTAIHMVDALRHIAGEVVDFRPTVRRDEGLSARWYEISFDFDSGCRGVLEILPTAGMSAETYEVFGEGYRVRAVAPVGCRASLTCWAGGELAVDEPAGPDEPADVQVGAYGEVVEFVRGLTDGRGLWPTIREILPSAEICFEIAEAAGVHTDP